MKIFIIVTLLALITGFFLLDLSQYFSLDALKSQHQQFAMLYQQHPWKVMTLLFLLYVAVTALGLPVALILTLAAGAILGFWHGLIVVSFASTIGATVAFLLTRYLFHDSVQQRFGDRLETVNNGLQEDGALYVFGLRLVPIFPFFMINSLLALTPLKTNTFYWASQLGMLAGTAVYVNAGTQLAQISSTKDILSMKLLLSFSLLGLFPIVAKYSLNWIKRERVNE